MLKILFLLSILALIDQNETARILAVFPTPLISHQEVFRAIIHELISRDHEVVLITPLPEYLKGKSPENLMEIDVSNVTIEIWEERYIQDNSGKNKYSNGDFKYILQLAGKIVEKQFQIPEVKNFIRNNETFDLLLVEAWIRPLLFWTYIYDVPVISISSYGPGFNDYINLGGPVHPLLYPTSCQHETGNLNIWQKLDALYEYWKMHSMYNSLEDEENEMAKRLFGEVPPLRNQVKKIELLLLNIHPVWQGVRPVPMNIIHFGGMHLQDREPTEELTEELKQYLDSCTNGIVYVSFGTNTKHWMIPSYTQRKLLQAFSKLPCSVLWKWDGIVNKLPDNVRIGKWFPQAELLKHPNVRLFISQCGQQSIDEAIAAAVPLLALPLAADQWHNAAQVLHHRVGDALRLEKTDDRQLKNIIERTMRNESYRTNMRRMRKLIFDAPAPAPARAVNAIEYVLRHTARHIAAPTLHVHWYQYIELELCLIVLVFVLVSLIVFYRIFCRILYWIIKKVVKRFTARRSGIPFCFKNKV